MFSTVIHTPYAYGSGANVRVLDAAAGLSQAQLVAADDGGYGSVRGTLVHIAAAERLDLERWRGAAVAAETHAFVGGLTEEALGRAVAYVNLQGETWAYPFWRQLLHQATHATEPCSELAAALTRRGHSPGWLDLLVYLDEQNGRTEA